MRTCGGSHRITPCSGLARARPDAASADIDAFSWRFPAGRLTTLADVRPLLPARSWSISAARVRGVARQSFMASVPLVSLGSSTAPCRSRLPAARGASTTRISLPVGKRHPLSLASFRPSMHTSTRQSARCICLISRRTQAHRTSTLGHLDHVRSKSRSPVPALACLTASRHGDEKSNSRRSVTRARSDA